MILESIKLENWKKFRNPVEINFRDGLNVIYGPNESGKTTVIDALRTTLFSKNSSRSQNIKSVVPWGSKLAPKAMITFQDDGQRYRITKRFMHSESVLEKWNRETWEKISEGDLADRAVAQITGGELPKRNNTTSRNWGIGQCLWMIQGKPVISDDLNDQTFSSLQSIVGASIESEDEKKVIKQIEDMFSGIYTEVTRKLKKRSQLSKTDAIVKSLQNQLQDSQTRLSEKETLIHALEQNESRLVDYREKQAKTEEDLGKLKKRIEEAQEHKSKREELEYLVESLRARYQTLKERTDDAKEITVLNSKNITLKDEKIKSEGELSHLKKEEISINREIGELKKVAHELSEDKKFASIAHSTVMREFQLEKDVSRLHELRSLQEKLESKEEKLKSIKAPSKFQLNEIEGLKNRIVEYKTKLDATGLDIHVSCEGSFNGSIHLDGRVQKLNLDEGEDGNWKAHQAVKIQVEELGTFEVKSGSEDVKNLELKLEELESSYMKMVEPYPYLELEPLRELLNQKVNLEKDVQHIKAELDQENMNVLLTETQDAEDRINQNWHKIPDDSPYNLCRKHNKKMVVDILSRKIEKIEGLEAQFKVEEGELEAKAHMVQEKVRNLEKSIYTLESGINGNIQVIQTLRSRLAGLDEDSLESEKRSISLELEKKENVLDAYREEMGEKEEAPMSDYKVHENRSNELRESIMEVELSNAGMESELKNIRMYVSNINQLEESLKYKEKIMEDLKVDADAVELLHDLTQHYKKNTVSSLTDPVRKIVTQDLQKILGPRYFLEFDSTMKPCSVTPEGYSDRVLLDSLSFGTQEQVWCLFRLALGRLLSEEERQLVVLDDPLVNTDPLRMQSAIKILDESARAMQVVVVTCDVDRYLPLKDAAFICMEDL